MTHFSLTTLKGESEAELFDRYWDNFDKSTRTATGANVEKALQFRFLSSEVLANIHKHDAQYSEARVDFSFNLKSQEMRIKILYDGAMFDQNSSNAATYPIKDFCERNNFTMVTKLLPDNRIRVEISLNTDVLDFHIDTEDPSVLEIRLQGKYQKGTSPNALKFENLKSSIKGQLQGKVLLLNLKDLDFWDTRGITAVMEHSQNAPKTAIVANDPSIVVNAYKSALEKPTLKSAKGIKIFPTKEEAMRNMSDW